MTNKECLLSIRPRMAELGFFISSGGPLNAVFAFFRSLFSLRGTDLSRATLELRKLAAIVESADDAIVSKRLDGTITSWNRGAEWVFGYTASEMIGRNIRLLIPSHLQQEEDEIIRRLGKGERIDHYETVRLRKDGSLRNISLSVAVLRDESGAAIGAFKIARDITEAKKSQRLIEASLREKEVLLREIHHRVKNNLQIISSLLSLQGSQSQDPEVLRKFHDSQSRIRSMALVHEMLYGSKNLSSIEMAPYMEGLVQQLLTSYELQNRVSLRLQAGDVRLPIDIAIPCGLILNELVLNAMKHAYAGREKGTLEIRLESDAGRSTLVVKDDGVGFKEGVDPRKTDTLGLRLVQLLVHQLEGKLEIVRENGVLFRITFPKELSKKVYGVPELLHAPDH